MSFNTCRLIVFFGRCPLIAYCDRRMQCTLTWSNLSLHTKSTFPFVHVVYTCVWWNRSSNLLLQYVLRRFTSLITPARRQLCIYMPAIDRSHHSSHPHTTSVHQDTHHWSLRRLQNYRFSVEESSFSIEESLKNLHFILKNLDFYAPQCPQAYAQPEYKIYHF